MRSQALASKRYRNFLQPKVLLALSDRYYVYPIPISGLRLGAAALSEQKLRVRGAGNPTATHMLLPRMTPASPPSQPDITAGQAR
jgi:hypothetical protein